MGRVMAGTGARATPHHAPHLHATPVRLNACALEPPTCHANACRTAACLAKPTRTSAHAYVHSTYAVAHSP